MGRGQTAIPEEETASAEQEVIAVMVYMWK